MTPRSLADTVYRSTAESELTKSVPTTALGELIEYTGETTVRVIKMTRVRFHRRTKKKQVFTRS